MIAKHIAMNAAGKSSFTRLVRYLTDAQGKEVRTGTVRITNCISDSAQAAALEILNTQAMNTRSTADKTYHLLISFRRDENPDAATLAAIEDRLCDGLGFTGHQRISVVHEDTDNLHVHVSINKIHPTRYTIHEPFRAYRVLAKLCDRLENEFGLQKDNHTPRQVGAENRASDMEHHAGIESLLGWIKRECKEQMLGAQSWEQLHAVLAEHGLRIHPRANGLVISADDGTMVKAGSVGREFSKPNLEKRFGSFQATPRQQISRKPTRRYQKQPIASSVDTTELYARYRAAQAEALDSRARERDLARGSKERRIEAAKRSVRLKRAALKLASMPRPAKKLMYSALSHALGEEIAAIKNRYRLERQAIDRQHRRSQWTDWLRREAETGDLQALAALRGRNRQGGLTGNTVTGDVPPQRPVRPVGHDSVTRKGTIIYRVGNSAIRDDGGSLKVSLGADQAAMQSALRMAIVRYGERIAVNGSDTFKQQILMAAVAGKLRVTFSDTALEQRRSQLVRASSTRGKTEPPRARQGVEEDKRRGPDHVGIHEVPGPTRTTESAPPPETEASTRSNAAATTRRALTTGAADRYIAEREQKRVNGFDIPKHARYTSLNAGTAAYAGMRRIDGHALALLKQGDEVMVLEVDEATARRLRHLPLGAQLGVNAQGAIKSKGRSR
ncbi:relaxase/mobilization nuclease domain-containing protein [Massilia sp. TW-1]|uniref:Relaxase/mobilization nuclease domain-containing protein n=1 Tax=Telluria antibiotica TaxID=2717319 RepID=A0ABX0PM64_9BURK|nr:TraI/MobA(P) family conjugative relaxase [Telluria antibiotica]NIA56980.1 relaxase/mobilization nuclease domain-containing protein [Telluria antibiotica]